jgi:hypothetical protein
MGRQLFQDGPYVDTMVASPSAYTAITATAMWVATQYTPIFANDAKANKIYCVHAGGIMTAATATTLIITPSYTTNTIALGPSLTQTIPATIAAGTVWLLTAELVWRVIGAPGQNSSAVLIGKFEAGGAAATAASSIEIPFGATLAVNLDASVNSALQFTTTFGAGTCSIQPHFAYIFSRN